MPILPPEPELYPEDLWSRKEPEARVDGGRRWWCLHAKPRQEKTTARHLHMRRIPFYLPMVAREGRTPSGRKTRSLVPLFAGYLFLLGDDMQRLQAFQANSLVQILEIDDQLAIDGDLRRIDQMLRSGLPVESEAGYPVGAPIRIVSGPLAGLVGVVTRRDDRDRFTAIVQFLRQGAAVTLKDWQVESIADRLGQDPPKGGLG